MNPELIALLDRFVTAHEKLAEGVASISDSLKYTEGPDAKINLATELSYNLGRIGSSIEGLAEALTPPEE